MNFALFVAAAAAVVPQPMSEAVFLRSIRNGHESNAYGLGKILFRVSLSGASTALATWTTSKDVLALWTCNGFVPVT